MQEDYVRSVLISRNGIVEYLEKVQHFYSTQGLIAKAGKWYKTSFINIPLGFKVSLQTWGWGAKYAILLVHH